ncbi:MAG: hypothetical protein IKN43_03070, partial [Selenomonadaceae bacterium]|nr:hypothetical protein [Selenomonadaceae bacterium]
MKDTIIVNHAEVLLENIGIELRRKVKLDGSDDELLESFIKNVEPNELHTALHLDYIFSDSNTDNELLPVDKKIAIIAHINYPDLIDKCLSEYIFKIPSGIDVFITTKGESNIKEISEK